MDLGYLLADLSLVANAGRFDTFIVVPSDVGFWESIKDGF